MTPPLGSGPEEIAREAIDSLLGEAGWIVQSRDQINLSAGRGVAVREFKLAQGFGFADYLLFVDGRAVGGPSPGSPRLEGADPKGPSRFVGG